MGGGEVTTENTQVPEDRWTRAGCGCTDANEFGSILHRAACPGLIWEYLIGDGSTWPVGDHA